jgi:crotonobetainyl-CoA:carnitine CoA-transferase CaiB-like acyl-CoA transferase
VPPASRGGPLAGLRVLDTATLYAAPLVSTLLADHGADVVKVEPPEGDAYRREPTGLWTLLARNKRSVVMDLRAPEGQEELRALVRAADVVIVNLPQATLAARGLDHDTLLRVNPTLIIGHVSTYGLEGPYADRPGNGTIAEAFAGLTHMTGDPDGKPMLSSVPLGDAVTGFAGALAVLAACFDRVVSGRRGQVIDISQIDAMLHVVAPMLTQRSVTGRAPVRRDGRLAAAPLRDVFATADGSWVVTSLSTPRHVAEVADLVGDDDHEPALRRWIAARPLGEVVAIFVQRRLPVTAVHDADDLVADPHVLARGSIGPVALAEGGEILSPAPAPRLLGRQATLPWRTPALGEHDAEVRSEWCPEP